MVVSCPSWATTPLFSSFVNTHYGKRPKLSAPEGSRSQRGLKLGCQPPNERGVHRCLIQSCLKDGVGHQDFSGNHVAESLEVFPYTRCARPRGLEEDVCEFVRNCEAPANLRLACGTENPKSPIFMSQFTHNWDVFIIYDFRHVQSGAKCVKIGRRAMYARKHLAYDCRNGLINAVDARHLPKAACCGTLPLHGDSENSVIGYL